MSARTAGPGAKLMNDFDVVVMGAGPAGCAAAIHCAQRGLRVGLVERRHFPRHRPGETLHPGAEPLLQQLGGNAVLTDPAHLRHAGHWVHWDGPPRFHGFDGDAWRGFQIPRALLDQQLLQQAHTLGVQVSQPKCVSQVLQQHGRVQGVQVGAAQWTARYVVDATGRHGWLQRQLQIPSQRFSPRLIARYGYCENSDLPDTALGLFANRYGWHWLARISRTCVHWTQLYFYAADICRAIPSALGHRGATDAMRGADVTWRCAQQAAGPGYFLVGDAAVTLDPCASHGVIKALISGMQAASAIVDCLSWPAGEPSIQAAYQAWIQEGFKRDVTALRSFYQAHPHPPAWLHTQE